MQTADSTSSGLQQSLGLFDSTMIVAGSMVGAGIFIVSADMARLVGSPGWLLGSWVITGLLTIARGLGLRRVGRHDASGRRPIRLFARGLVAIVRILIRLDLFHGDPNRNHRRGGSGVRPLPGDVMATHFRERVYHCTHSYNHALTPFRFPRPSWLAWRLSRY